MPDIMMLLASLCNCLSKTTLRRLARIGEVLLPMTIRVTMQGLSRWTDPEGSYRTVQ